MATPDIIILIVVLLSAAIGLVRGLLKEVVSLASWLAARNEGRSCGWPD